MVKDKGLSTIAIILIVIIAGASVGITAYVLTRPQPDFQVEDLSLSSNKVARGDTVTARVEVTNTGDARGTHTVKLEIEGETLEKEVILDAGESRTVDFDIEKQEKGTYNLNIEDLSESFEVVEPARFETSNFRVSPKSPVVGEEFTASIDVKNVGELEGTYRAVWKVEGNIDDTHEVALNPRETRTVKFSMVWNEAGTYEVSLSGMSKTLTVFTPAEFEVSNLTVSPSKVGKGKPVDISVDVRNVGDLSGDYKVELQIDGDIEDSQTVTLNGGESTTVSFTIQKETKKSYSVNIGDLTQSFEVLEPAIFEISNFTLNPKEPVVKEKFSASIDVRNVGGLRGTYKAVWRVEGSVDDTHEVTLGPGETRTVTFSMVWNETGTYSVSLSGMSKTLTVLKPAEFEFNNFSVNPSPASSGEPVDVSIDVKNIGEVSGEYTVKLKVNGDIEKSQTVNLDGGKEQTVSFSITKDSGTYTIKIEGFSDSLEVYKELHRITNVDELQAIKNDLSAHYILTNDIDASETRQWNDGKGFEPIGDIDDRFSGNFDGQGHVIKNLYIDRSDESDVGLFGFVKDIALVRNVGVVDVNVTGKFDVGGLVGWNNGIVRGSYATGEITVEDFRGGGLVGTNIGNLNDSYATCDVTGGDAVGGLVGQNFGGVNNSYASGYVTGPRWGDLGGLIGSLGIGGMVNNSFWDIWTSGQYTSEGGTKLTTPEMQSLSTFEDAGWDFEEIWWITEGETYPRLRVFKTSSFEVLEPAEFELSNLSINPSQVATGKTVEISVDVQNAGDLSGDCKVELQIDGDVEDSQTVSLNVGESTTVSFTIQKETKKSYSVSIGNLTGNFEVVTPFTFQDKFDDGVADGWTERSFHLYHSERWELPNPWSVLGGEYHVNTGMVETAMSTVSNLDLSECTVQTKLRFGGEQIGKGGFRAGIIFGYENPLNRYALELSHAYTEVGFHKYTSENPDYGIGGKGIDYNIQANVEYTLKLRVEGTTFIAYLNGERILSWSDPNYTGGMIGLSSRSANVYFDDFSVKSDVTGKTQPSENISRYFEWTDHLSEEWSWELNIELRRYQYYQTLSHTAYSKEDYLGFVTYQDGLVKHMADELSSMYSDPDNESNYALSFVQSLGYSPENEEYIRYPVETIVDNGDCEDTAILYAAIMKAAGYDVALIDFENHMMAGVNLLELPQDGSQNSIHWFEKNGKRYYTCEATGTGWHVGDLPEQYQEESAHVYIVD